MLLLEHKDLLIKAIQEVFEGYGFNAEVIDCKEDGEEIKKGIIEITFSKQKATGMSSFSIDTIEPYAHFWYDEGKIVGHVRLGVSYKHHGGGSNGWSVSMVAIPVSKYGDIESVKLIDDETFVCVARHLRDSKQE